VTKPNFKLLFFICGFMTCVHAINMLSGFALNQFGIVPRNLGGLWAIVVSPFLHTGIFHLVNNMIALFVLSTLFMLHSNEKYIQSVIMICLLGGLMVWLFGRNSSHVGASGLIFGLWSLCIASAFFEKKIIHIVIAFLVLVFYGGLIFGIIPRDPRISFEAHFFGLIAGIMCSFINLKLGAILPKKNSTVI
jgi:membrane associated rhomboid family serine protease